MEEDYPLISVGLPTYNRPEGLKSVIDSLLKQSYKNIEIIVSDNCSPNVKVQELFVKDFANEKKIIYHRQNTSIGIINNFTFVADRATGDYFMWKADDDIINDNDFIFKLYEALMKTGAEFAFPEGYYYKENGSPQSVLKEAYINCEKKIEYLNACTKSFSCLEFYGMYNLKLFKKNNGELRFLDIECPDVFYIPQLFLNHKVVFVPETSYTFKHIPDLETFKRNLKIFEERTFALNKLIEYFSGDIQLASNDKAMIIRNIKKYLDDIQREHYSIPIYKRVEFFLKNRIKLMLGIGKQ